jgi:hypothetical protein
MITNSPAYADDAISDAAVASDAKIFFIVSSNLFDMFAT